MIKLKYNEYEDFNRELTLRKDIPDLTPYDIKLPEPPPMEEFINFGLPKKEQFFQYDEIPNWVWQFDKEIFKGLEERERLGEIINNTKEYREYIESVWNKRRNGIWIMIHGKPLHITGLNWWFLNYYRHLGHKLAFRYEDTEYFYWWKFCIKDNPKCFGGIELARRQEGKCHVINELIRMYDGSVKKVQDIVDGDLVMGDDSTPRVVSGVISGSEDMYDVKLYTGDSFGCNGSHILALYYNKDSGDSVMGWEKKSYITISVKDYIKLPENKKKHLVAYYRGWGEHFKEVKHKIPPYLLGLYLGDGTQSSGNITNPDVEVQEYISDFCINNNFTYTLRNKYLNCINRNVGELNNRYRDELKNINVFENKHIPLNYLIDSEKNRLDLLAGIIDTDGHKTKNHYEVIQKNEVLSKNIVELAKSLGFCVTIKTKNAVLKRQNKGDYTCLVYRILISGDTWRIPVKIKRKKIEIHSKRNNVLNSGIKVIPRGVEQYFGFEVDKNHLYLLANGIVTHNSTRAGAILLEDTTKGSYKSVGLQSKDETSIKSFMSKCIVDPFNKLPFYFRPVTDSTRLTPSKKLNFRHPSDKDDSLYNWIESRPATEKAFDGETLTGYMGDEFGKATEMMVSDTWDVHKECLRVLNGKAILTSTVEESTRGGMDEFKKIWDRADHAEVNIAGETESGLIRYFRPSYQTIRFDQYGFSIINDPTEEQYEYLVSIGESNPRMGGKELIDATIDSVKDATKKAALIRKYPRTIREAFRKSSVDCHFDIIRINSQLDKYLYFDNEIIGGNPDVIVGNFSWKDNKKDTEVVFRECPEGRWKLHRKLFKYLSKRANQFRTNNVGEKVPLNKNLGCLGADPFKYDATDEKRKSLGTFHGYLNYSLSIENEYQEDNGQGQISDNFFLEYGYRQENTMLYGEDVIMSCVYFGMQVFPEINVPTLVQYMKIRGYGGYLKFRKMWKKVEGRWQFQVSANAGMQTSSEQVINSLFSYVTDYLFNHCERCVYPRTLEDFANVERNFLKDYDYFVSASYALYGAKNDYKEEVEEEKKKEPTIISNPLNFLKA